ncbi:ankyrin repeat-containing domain protein [Dipodascopsis tothii]|uniref:ankyrin repeat-containing domain protein n=1 Tax=Dipodascopsis tothii TaxID=44089 RepID=UPI0034CEC26C
MASQDDDGAKPGELLLEAARRNNTDLLEETLSGYAGDASELINSAHDALGNTALHLAAINGSYECLDILLDVEGVEVDPINRLEGDTPLHSAVRYSEEEPEHGAFIADVLIDAGCDPRIRNKEGLKPIDLVPASGELMTKTLRGAELALMMGPAETVETTVDDDDEGASDSE